jgi:hypothetical protein
MNLLVPFWNKLIPNKLEGEEPDIIALAIKAYP